MRAWVGLLLGVLSCHGGAGRVPDPAMCPGGEPEVRTYALDPAFTADERYDIMHAFQAWAEGTRERIVFRPSPLPDIDVQRARSIDWLAEHFDARGTSPIGYYSRPERTIWLVKGRDDIADTMAHEIGHWIGLEHVNDFRSIMQRTGGRLDEGRIPDVDLGSFCELKGCRCVH